MIVAGIIVGYLLASLVTLRIEYIYDTKDEEYHGTYDGEDVAITLVVALVWPLTALIFGIYCLGRGFWHIGTMPTRQQRREAKLEDIKKERARLDARITELEEELL